MWVIVGGLSFVYFIILTGGKEDPYLWSFLETMQLLTHIQLINVKVPGNAALFLNLNNKLFRYDFFPTDWVSELFNLELVPSPLPVFIQIRYLQVHMLNYTIFIFGCISIVLLLMIMTPICPQKCSVGIKKRLFWGLPVRMSFEFFFILALTSLHNMLNSETTDVSLYVSYAVIICLSIYTAYVWYIFILSLNVKAETEREKKKTVQALLLFI